MARSRRSSKTSGRNLSPTVSKKDKVPAHALVPYVKGEAMVMRGDQVIFITPAEKRGLPPVETALTLREAEERIQARLRDTKKPPTPEQQAVLVAANNQRVREMAKLPPPKPEDLPLEGTVYCVAIRKIPRQGYQFAEFRAPAETVVDLIDGDPDSKVSLPELLGLALAGWQERLMQMLRRDSL